MNTLIRIIAQYKEEGKMKGGCELNVNVDLDILMYDEEMSVQIFKELLAKQSNEYCQYIYISHAPVFHKPVILNDQEFEDRYIELATERSKNNPDPDEIPDYIIDQQIDELRGK